jgi:hypothetical protein
VKNINKVGHRIQRICPDLFFIQDLNIKEWYDV